MSARIPPGFAELWYEQRATNDNESMYCSFGIDVEAGSTVTTTVVNRWMQIIDDAWDQDLSSWYSSGVGHCIVGQDGGDLRIDGSRAPTPYTGAPTALPPNCALLVRKITASGGRRGRGRFYLPGVIEAYADGAGLIDSGTIAILQTNAGTMLSNLLLDADIAQVVLLHSTAPFTPTVITNFVVQNRLATQRRRLRP